MIKAQYWRAAGTVASLVAAVAFSGASRTSVYTTNLKRRF
jgi:hypothetical protein